MGDNHRVHTVQRQPPIYPAGHGLDGGADVLGMVGKGTLIYSFVYHARNGIDVFCLLKMNQ